MITIMSLITIRPIMAHHQSTSVWNFVNKHKAVIIMNGHQIVIVGFMKIVIGLAESISILILLAILTVIKNDKKIKTNKEKKHYLSIL